jgi:hypothetical protein
MAGGSGGEGGGQSMLGGLMSNLKAGSRGDVQAGLDPMGIFYKPKPPAKPFLQQLTDPGSMPSPQDTDRVAWLQAFGLGGQ